MTKNKKSFVHDVMRLLTGTVVAQGVTGVASILIARLFSPEAFGSYAIFTSMTSVLVGVASLRYEQALMLPKDEGDAANILSLCIVTTTLISILAFGISTVFGGYMDVCFKTVNILSNPFWFSVTIFAGGMMAVFNSWDTRQARYGRLSVSRVVNTSSTAGIQIFAGLFGMQGGISLIAGNTVGNGLAALFLAVKAVISDWNRIISSISVDQVISCARRYKKFPAYSVGATFLNNLSWQLPAMVLSFYFSPVVAGFYALGWRVLKTPMNLIGASIAQVFYQRASNASGSGPPAIIVEQTLKRLVYISFFPMLMLTICGDNFFEFVFGSSWIEAGVYIQIMGMWAFVWFISSPMSTLFCVMEKQEYLLIISLINLATRFASLSIGGYFHDARLAITLFSVSGVVVYSYMNLMVMKYSGVSMRNVLSMFARHVLCVIPAGLVILAAKYLPIVLAAKMLIYCSVLLIYFVVFLYCDRELRIRLFKRRSMCSIEDRAA